MRFLPFCMRSFSIHEFPWALWDSWMNQAESSTKPQAFHVPLAPVALPWPSLRPPLSPRLSGLPDTVVTTSAKLGRRKCNFLARICQIHWDAVCSLLGKLLLIASLLRAKWEHHFRRQNSSGHTMQHEPSFNLNAYRFQIFNLHGPSETLEQTKQTRAPSPNSPTFPKLPSPCLGLARGLRQGFPGCLRPRWRHGPSLAAGSRTFWPWYAKFLQM